MLDGLAVLPLDGVFEQVGEPSAAGDAAELGGAAVVADRDHQALVVEAEPLQWLAIQLGVEVAATVSASSRATWASGGSARPVRGSPTEARSPRAYTCCRGVSNSPFVM
jgi:hypothetical protein